MTRYMAIANNGASNPCESFASACAWLNEVEPQFKTQGFVNYASHFTTEHEWRNVRHDLSHDMGVAVPETDDEDKAIYIDRMYYFAIGMSSGCLMAGALASLIFLYA